MRGSTFLLMTIVASTAGCGGGAPPAPGPVDQAMASPDLPSVPDLATNADLAAIDLEEGDLAVPDEGIDLAAPDGTAGDLATIDTAIPSCDGTPKSCGAPGACVDCSMSTVGTACVKGACGCVTSADCPAGSACDPVTATCSTSCAGGLLCNGGCCDGMKCLPGTDASACGADGGGCVACAGGTPTCAAGLCTASCNVGGVGMPGVCGKGFCCNAQNQCTSVANAACGPDGAACADCSKSANGPLCLDGGSCGCRSQADCPTGQACKDGGCSTVCDANSPCNGGCCASGSCAPGTAPAACALGGAQCGSCAGNPAGTACVAQNGKTACGCLAPSDCAVGQACDPATHTCGAKCSQMNPCNGGCCSAAQNGTCQVGSDGGACGATGGVCVNCALAAGGKVCKPVAGGGQCGCDSLGDCPPASSACTNGTCDTSCSPQKPCQSGCCSNGTCAIGTTVGACGASGACADCTMGNAGLACRAGQACGCDKPGDCPMGLSCNLGTHLCETSCNVNQPCNGGCCSAAQNGTCVPGSSGSACGGGGALCVDCTLNKLGHSCIAGACGCAGPADCGALQACDPNAMKCTSACGANQLCNGGCCQAGTCAAGTANSACGGDGNACAACQGATPTCVNAACSAQCGGPNDGTCGQGNCCSNGACVPGNAQSACGYTGACRDCTNQSTGTRCIAPQNSTDWTCGCLAKTDCLAANPGSGITGYACDTVNQSCTSLCGIAGLTTCNGGCCSGPNGQCRAGNADTSCGINGGYCTNCASSCNPGPKCNAMTGGCGCTSAGGQCNTFTPCFQNGANRFGCNLAASSCCVPGIYSFKDNGNPAGCCTGQSMNGSCTCLLQGAPTGNPAEPWACCSLTVDGNGNCQCLGTGTKVDFGIGPEPRACCSNRASGSNCVCSPVGGTCQANAGCCAPATCQNGVCK